MARGRMPKPNYFPSKRGYYTTICGERIRLANGPECPENRRLAEEKFRELTRPIPCGVLASDGLLTPRQASTHLAISESLLAQLTIAGEVACVRISRSIRYRAADLNEWARRSAEGVAKKTREEAFLVGWEAGYAAGSALVSRPEDEELMSLFFEKLPPERKPANA